jgi:hypothetical protein
MVPSIILKNVYTSKITFIKRKLSNAERERGIKFIIWKVTPLMKISAITVRLNSC